jgi:hypothetical protein
MTMCGNCRALWLLCLQSRHKPHSTLSSIILMNVFINRGRGVSLLKVIVRMFLNLLNGNRSVLQV